MVREALEGNRPVVTVEDHALQGGFGSIVLETAQDMGIDSSNVARLGLPDRFIEHGSRSSQLSEAGIDATSIASTIMAMIEGTSGPGTDRHPDAMPGAQKLDVDGRPILTTD